MAASNDFGSNKPYLFLGQLWLPVQSSEDDEMLQINTISISQADQKFWLEKLRERGSNFDNDCLI